MRYRNLLLTLTLTLTYVHRDIRLNSDTVIDDFAKSNRRLQF